MIAIIATEHYDRLFEEPMVIRSHLYVDTPLIQCNTESVKIPLVTYPKVAGILRNRKKTIFRHL